MATLPSSVLRSSSPAASERRFFLEVIRVIAGRQWMLHLEHEIECLTLIEDGCREAAKALMDSPEEVEIRKWLVEEATQTVSRTNEIDKITPKTREALAERWLLLNKLMKGIELSYRAANSVDAWPFLGEQPSSEAVVEAKDWLVEVLKQAEHTVEWRQLRSDEIVRGRSSDDELLPARGLQQARLRIWDTTAIVVPGLLAHCQEVVELTINLAKRQSRDLQKLQEWLSESVIDLVLHWKESSMERGGV